MEATDLGDAKSVLMQIKKTSSYAGSVGSGEAGRWAGGLVSDYRDHFKREQCVEGREVSYSLKSC